MLSQTKTYISHELIQDELASRGYEVQQLQLGESFTCYTARSGRSWLTRDATLSYPFVTGGARLICKDKQLSQIFAKSQGITVPETLMYPEQKSELGEFLQQNSPLVVKPLDSFGSRGVTLDITSADQLEQGIQEATTFSAKALVQRQFAGHEVRVTICRGEVVAAILRQTPRVLGDGKLSVAELIAKENEQREHLEFAYITYPQLSDEIISSRFMTDTRIPKAGEVVELSKSTLVRTGASLYNITDEIHDSYKTVAVQLTNTLNPDFMIVDLLIQDYQQPMEPRNYVLLEFTTSPALKMYYGMRNKKQIDMVRVVADMVDEYCA